MSAKLILFYYGLLSSELLHLGFWRGKRTWSGDEARGVRGGGGGSEELVGGRWVRDRGLGVAFQVKKLAVMSG